MHGQITARACTSIVDAADSGPTTLPAIQYTYSTGVRTISDHHHQAPNHRGNAGDPGLAASLPNTASARHPLRRGAAPDRLKRPGSLTSSAQPDQQTGFLSFIFLSDWPGNGRPSWLTEALPENHAAICAFKAYKRARRQLQRIPAPFKKMYSWKLHVSYLLPWKIRSAAADGPVAPAHGASFAVQMLSRGVAQRVIETYCRRSQRVHPQQRPPMTGPAFGHAAAGRSGKNQVVEHETIGLSC